MPAYDPNSLDFLITDSSRLFRVALETRIAAEGFTITPSEARALVYIGAGDGSRQAEIALRMGVEPMTISGYIDRLEQAGLAVRKPDPADRRAKNVFVTDRAEAVLSDVRKAARSLLAEILDDLREDVRKAFEQGMRHLRDRLREKVEQSK